MNPGQQMFYDFVLQRVREDKTEEAKAMMLENFRLQEAGLFTLEVMRQNAPKMLSLIKPEFVEEFQQAAAHMSSTLGK